jgi:hypothetical protein
VPKTAWQLLKAAYEAVERQRMRADSFARRTDVDPQMLAVAVADIEAIDCFLYHHATVLSVRLDNEMRRARFDSEIGVIDFSVRVRADKHNAIRSEIPFLL